MRVEFPGAIERRRRLRAGGAGRGPKRTEGPAIVVEFSGGIRVSVRVDAPAALVTATLQALR